MYSEHIPALALDSRHSKAEERYWTANLLSLSTGRLHLNTSILFNCTAMSGTTSQYMMPKPKAATFRERSEGFFGCPLIVLVVKERDGQEEAGRSERIIALTREEGCCHAMLVTRRRRFFMLHIRRFPWQPEFGPFPRPVAVVVPQSRCIRTLFRGATIQTPPPGLHQEQQKIPTVH